MKKMKRYFALLLCLCMAVAILTPAATAEEKEEPVQIQDTQVQEEQTALQEDETPTDADTPAEGENLKKDAGVLSGNLQTPGEMAEPMETDMTWAQLQSALNAGGTVTLSSNVTASSASTALVIPEDVTVTLDLNGHTIDRALSQAKEDGEVLHVLGSLTLRDSVGGGTITGGNNSGDGGGVFLDYDATLNMQGGTITGNQAVRGGGIYVDVYGDFRISGAPVVTGNTGGNVFLDCYNDQQARITVSGTLDSSAALGVGIGTPAEDVPVTFTSGLSGFGTPDLFSSDDVSLQVTWNSKQTDAVLFKQNGMSWGNLQALLFSDGEIILSSDVVAGDADTCLFVPQNVDVTLDLNGFKIDRRLSGPDKDGQVTIAGCVIRVYGKLTITDSSATDAEKTNGTGTITGGYTSSGGGVYVTGGSFVMNGGHIKGNFASYSGGGVYVSNGGQFIMNGGGISKNRSSFGGGISLLYHSKFSLFGGTIEENTATSNGGGIYVENIESENFVMKGGSIVRNTAGDEYSGFGGGIFISGTSNKEANNMVVISGGSIAENMALFGGGIGIRGGAFEINGFVIENNQSYIGSGIYSVGGDLTMSGGEIRSNSAVQAGAGVYINNSDFTMTGGTVTENQVSANPNAHGSGVFVDQDAHLILSGKPVIYDNTKDGETTDGVAESMQENVCLTNGRLILVTGALKSGAKIGVVSRTPLSADPTPLTAGLTSKGRISAFVSDDPQMIIGWNKAKNEAVLISKDLKIIQQPMDSVVAAIGETVSIEVVAAGQGLSYEWWIRNPGASAFTKSVIKKATYSTPISETSNGREVYCIVKDQLGNSIQTDTVRMRVKEPLTITKQPMDCSVSRWQNASFVVDAKGEGLQYEWWCKPPYEESFSVWSRSSKEFSLYMSEDMSGAQIYCVVTDQYGESVQSDIATAFIPVQITQHPVNCRVSAYGETASFTVVAKGTGLSYQWWIKNPGSTKFTKSVNTGSVYNSKVTEASDGRLLYCIVKDQFGNSAQTDTVSMTGPDSLEITKQPESCQVDAIGDTARFEIEAVGVGLKYEWWIKNPGAYGFTKSVITKSVYSTKVTESSNGRLLFCVVTDKNGNSVQSETVTMTVREPIRIIEQPYNYYASKIGERARFTVVAEGEDLSYQWVIVQQTKLNRQSDSIQSVRVTSATYTPIVTNENNGASVYCIITDKHGNSIQTNVVRMLAPEAVQIMKQPEDCVVEAIGDMATFQVVAEGEGLTYTWWIKNPSSTTYTKSVIKKATYSTPVTATSNGRELYCVVKDKNGNTVQSDTVTMRIGS